VQTMHKYIIIMVLLSSPAYAQMDYNSGYGAGASPGAVPVAPMDASPAYQSGYDAGAVNNEMMFEDEQRRRAEQNAKDQERIDQIGKSTYSY